MIKAAEATKMASEVYASTISSMHRLTNVTERKPLLTPMSTPRMPGLPFRNFSSNFSGMDDAAEFPKSRDFIKQPVSAKRILEKNLTDVDGAYLQNETEIVIENNPRIPMASSAKNDMRMPENLDTEEAFMR